VIDLYFYFTVGIGVILFGIAKGGFAGPIAILSIPLMSLTMSPQKAAGILLPILIIMDFIALYIYWKKWDLKNIKIIIPISIIGIIIGTFTFSFVSDDGIRIIIGVIAILFIFLSFIQKNSFLIKPTKNKGFFWSLIAGYTSFLIHSGGTPINFFLLPQKMNKTIYMGTITLFFLIINLIKLIPYYYLGQLDISNIKTSLLFSPLAPVSILIGYYLHKKVSESIFYNFIYFFLGIGGIKLIYDGIF
tara:strand:+ start:258 stop:995 length:738 start_codon:yes stop_codon:yes gene_type:complete